MATAKKSSTSKKSSGSSAKRGGTSKSASSSKKRGGSSSSKGRSTSKRGSGKRELINTGTDKRFVRRDGQGQFKESDDVSRSLPRDTKQRAKTKAAKGQGDRGDR